MRGHWRRSLSPLGGPSSGVFFRAGGGANLWRGPVSTGSSPIASHSASLIASGKRHASSIGLRSSPLRVTRTTSASTMSAPAAKWMRIIVANSCATRSENRTMSHESSAETNASSVTQTSAPAGDTSTVDPA